jgi:carbohydrate kinase (thermoresistant glucokinase family)
MMPHDTDTLPSQPTSDSIPRVIVLMGVSGSGKTTLGMRVAETLGVSFIEGDSLHPSSNVSKMRAGIPLNDDDRAPWLAALGVALRDATQRQGCAVAACSALKRTYRDLLRSLAGDVYFVALGAETATLQRRLGERRHAYMPASLLQSQLNTFEPLQDDEAGTSIGVDGALDMSLSAILRAIVRDQARPYPVMPGELNNPDLS